ncbi:ABC transporter permease [Phytomonospora endophytica]|uniref:ABC-2 type transport system permease protein n=1 Tax=Phytomonospora endophytica TaxID=714109 RepID=A0A841FTA5_9ACTN|nr:ABC transporter permease [Phytomonospora endophytica]MBB6039535.1 ABC-2 type transport system permease protein [Phytomonospora endophytica]GIG70499.1 hypothetical protein Pen01_67940 [Phytomonospora endophytica]
MTILKNNLRRMLGKKSSWVYLLLIPIALNIGIVAISSQQATWVIGVHDEDGTALTAAFTDTFGRDSDIVPVADPGTWQDDLLAADYDMLVVFPAGHTAAVIAGDAPATEVHVRGDNNRTDSLQARVGAFLNGVNAVGTAADGDAARFDTGLREYLTQKYDAEYTNFADGSAEDVSRAVSTLGYLAFGLMMMMGSAAGLLLEDRKRGVFDRVRTTPLRQSSYFLQYFASMGVIAAVQLVAVLAIIPFATGITYGSTPGQVGGVIAATLCFAAFCVAKSMLVYRFAPSTIVAATVNSLIDLPMLMIGGALWPRDIMPDALQRVGDYLPTHWYLNAGELAVNGASVQTLATPLALLLGASAVLVLGFTIRARRFR